MAGSNSPLQSTLFFEEYLLWPLTESKEFQNALSWAEQNIQGIMNLWSEKHRKRYFSMKEGELEDNLIRPLLRILGFNRSEASDNDPCYALFPTLYSIQGENYEPDYALFASGEHYREGSKYRGSHDNQYFRFSVGVGDAKAWGIDLDKKARKESPSQQILKYLIHSRKRYGFVTNGRQWRLHRAASTEALLRPNVFLQVDLNAICMAEDSILRAWYEHRKGLDDFDPTSERIFWLAYFGFFFGPYSFMGDGAVSYHGTELLERVHKNSSSQRIGVQDNLKEKVFSSLQTVCRGFYNCPDWKATRSRPPSEEDLKDLYASGLIFLYRLLFILNAESRGLLDSPAYRMISLSRLAEEIDDTLKQTVQQVLSPVYNFWKRVEDLFEVISSKERAEQVGVTHYDGGLFDPTLDKHGSLETWQLDDESIHLLLIDLALTEVSSGGVSFERLIDYGTLEVRHLGYIYEGLLEYKLRYTDKPLYLVNGKYVEKAPKSKSIEEVIFENSLYLSTDKMERRITGTYYTPDHIVDHIISSSLAPKCIAKDWSEILRLRILDPAMGSGHFLVSAIDFLAGSIHNFPDAELPPDIIMTDETDELMLWKRTVAERCIFGVDKNPLAVELAKLSIWLATANKGKALSFLDSQLRCGDSLLGTNLRELDFSPLEMKRGAKTRVGGIKQSILTDAVRTRVRKIAKNAERLEQLSASTAAEVTMLRDSYDRTVKQPLESLRVLADVWMNQWFINIEKKRILTQSDYGIILKSAVAGELSSDATERTPRRFFHWELEFPHVLGLVDNPGFDVIVGNPPYEVLSGKEIGYSVENETTFFKESGFYDLATDRKLNLFPLFIVRSLQLLRSSGTFSMIVPISLLGHSQSRLLRNWLISCDDGESISRVPIRKAGFTSIHAFHQHVDPKQRVFMDAKQATCVFHISAEPTCPESITVCTYSGRYFDTITSKYIVPLDSIRQIDSEQLVIPHNATQDEVDLAIRSGIHPRFVELRSIAKVAQGEFNITTSKQAGVVSEHRQKSEPVLLRGAHVARFYTQNPKQGADLYVKQETINNYPSKTKMVDTLKPRIILQEVGQADRRYRRIVANIVDPPSHCGHTIDYITDPKDYDLYAILAIVSSSFTEWRFRLTSTSNHVSVREIGNMLIPRFKIDESPLLSSSSSDENGTIQRPLTLAEPRKIDSIRKELLQGLVFSSKSNSWPLVVHDGLAALGRRLCFLGELRFKLVREFLAWLDDFLIAEVDRWKRNSVFRVFHTLDFKAFYSICRTNRASIGLVDWDGREAHKRLSEEFEKVLAQLHLALDESNEIEDLIDEVIFTMMDVDPSLQETIRERAGTRQPST